MYQNSIVSEQVRSRKTLVTTALLMVTVLAGCTEPAPGPGKSRYEPTYLRMTGEREFAQGLRRNYLELATNAFDRGDAVRSDFYSLRALMAAEGKLAHPVVHAGGGELATVGAGLLDLLTTGARTDSPDLASRAQAAYDCWKLESDPSGDQQIAQSCRFNALNTIAELKAAGTGAQLQLAGGPREPQGQTYVIEDGMPSQTINAPMGYTIEIITEHHAAAPQPHYVQAPAPASYTQTVTRPEPRYTAPVPAYNMEAVSAPQMIETVPIFEQAPMIGYVEQAPVVSEEYGDMAAFSIDQMSYGGNTSIPTITLEEYQTMVAPSYTDNSIVAEPAPMYQPTFEMAPIKDSLVYEPLPTKPMPMVEMAALPTNSGGTVRALVDGTTNLSGGFAIFFGLNSDEVTIEAEDVLIDAIERIKLSGTKRVTLTGFAYRMGTSRNNQNLAMRRAHSVREYLQEQLGDTVSFEILPLREVQAVANGGAGVKEALNRKVEIGLR